MDGVMVVDGVKAAWMPRNVVEEVMAGDRGLGAFL